VVDDDAWLDELPPLVRAAAIGDGANVAELLAVGVDPNQAEEDGWSALHAAATFDHTEIVELLLDAGAAIDERTDTGFTPLLNAAKATRTTVSILPQAGADPNAQAEIGWRPLDRFADYGNAEAIDLLIRAGAEVNHWGIRGGTALVSAAEQVESECVELLLAAGADPRLVDDEGATARSRAARQGPP